MHSSWTPSSRAKLRWRGRPWSSISVRSRHRFAATPVSAPAGQVSAGVLWVLSLPAYAHSPAVSASPASTPSVAGALVGLFLVEAAANSPVEAGALDVGLGAT